MIFKGQISLFTTAKNPLVRFYNKDRSIDYIDEATPEQIKLIGKDMKRFFHGELQKDGKLRIDRPAKWQDW